jgi:hypothetical protein
MKINRLISIVLIIGCSVFASYYGGNISYALFYLSLLIPLISFLYTVYVYTRFKLYQSMDNYQVVKGDWTVYSFIIANEDYITYRNVKVNFLGDNSMIEAVKSTRYSLLPGESEKLQTRIKCNYRGEYYVGVDSVEIMDFLYLFRITYPVRNKLKVVVLPRVVQLEELGIAPLQQDVKNPQRFTNSAQEELDTELRKYYPGDSRKVIHWKATAKMREMISRRYQHIPKAKLAVFMDLKKVKEDDLKAVIVEDKIIESVLAITNYYALRRTPATILYDLGGKQQVSISSKDDFDAFYRTCAKIRFRGSIPIHALLNESLLYHDDGLFCVIATHYLTKELSIASLSAVTGGNHVSILFLSDDISEDTKKIIYMMKQSGVNIYQIMSEEEIGNVLTGEAFSC